MMDSFETKRLTAERLTQDHLADLVTLHLDQEVSRFLGGVRSPEKTKAYLDENIAHWSQWGYGLWILRTKDGAFAGRAGIRHVMLEGASQIEIAYTFAKPMWGKGLASEIAASLTEIGLFQFRLPSLVGIVALEHLASRRVLEKLNYASEANSVFHNMAVAVYRKSRPIP